MIECRKLTKLYQTRQGIVQSLNNVDLQINQGEFVIIRGASGSGKSTLLFLIGAMLRPSSGEILLDGKNLGNLSDAGRNSLRRERIGFIFQMFHLIPFLDIRSNIELGGSHQKADPKRAIELLEQLGLADRQSHKPEALSAGERQRVAIARALFNEPDIILADEPTGNLDPANASDIFRRLGAIREAGKTVVVVTHGTAGDEFADRIITLDHGAIHSDRKMMAESPTGSI